MSNDDIMPSAAQERRLGKIETRTAVLEALQETMANDLHEIRVDTKSNYRLAITNLIVVGLSLLGLITVLVGVIHK